MNSGVNIERLTERDLLVWKYVVEGLALKQIAEKLNGNLTTALTRISLLHMRLGLPDDPKMSKRTQLVQAAMRFYNE